MNETEKMLVIILAFMGALAVTTTALDNRDKRRHEERLWNSQQLHEKKQVVYQTNSTLWPTNLNQK